jgi:hypothetical protein
MQEYVDLNAAVGSSDALLTDAGIALMSIYKDMSALASTTYPHLLEDEAYVILLQAAWESRYKRP